MAYEPNVGSEATDSVTLRPSFAASLPALRSATRRRPPARSNSLLICRSRPADKQRVRAARSRRLRSRTSADRRVMLISRSKIRHPGLPRCSPGRWCRFRGTTVPDWSPRRCIGVNRTLTAISIGRLDRTSSGSGEVLICAQKVVERTRVIEQGAAVDRGSLVLSVDRLGRVRRVTTSTRWWPVWRTTPPARCGSGRVAGLVGSARSRWPG